MPTQTDAPVNGDNGRASIADPPTSPRWLQVDDACAYLGGVSRKTAYAMVAAGMRVARLSDVEPKRDSRGRLCQGRILFYTPWIDSFLEARSTCPPLRERETVAAKSMNREAPSSVPPGDIATDLQRRPDGASNG
jgi:hypothetical protein